MRYINLRFTYLLTYLNSYTLFRKNDSNDDNRAFIQAPCGELPKLRKFPPPQEFLARSIAASKIQRLAYSDQTRCSHSSVGLM